MPVEHFDIAGLLEQVLEQDLGLQVSTNNPGGFRRILYAHMRKHPAHKCSIHADPTSPSRFLLLRPGINLPSGNQLENSNG